jgi:hypothetical protein
MADKYRKTSRLSPIAPNEFAYIDPHLFVRLEGLLQIVN